MAINIILTITAAIIGGLIAQKLKFPAPFMIGAMIGVAVLNVCTQRGIMPREVKNFTQSITGIYIGMRLSKKDIKSLKYWILPAVTLIMGFMCFTIIWGFMLHFLYHLDYATAFLVCVPGGVVDTSLMSYDLNANPTVVSLVQTFRASTVLLIFPPIITAVSKKHPMPETVEDIQIIVDDKESWIDHIIPNHPVVKQVFTLAIGLIGGICGYLLKMPAGCLSMSMIFTATVNVNSHRIGLPMKYRRGAQILAGSIIGSGVTLETIHGMKDIVLPAITVIIGYILANFIISFFMTKTKKIDYISAMFSSSPGGASDMALIAGEFGGETPKIAVLQVCRLISVLTVYPYLIRFLVSVLVN